MRDFFITLHSLVLMCHLNRQINSTELAQNICVNPVQVRRALSPLVSAEILQITEGRSGGYKLIADCDEILLSEIVKLSKVDFLSGMWHTGNENKSCCISAGMSTYLEKLHQQLQTVLLTELEKITVKQIEQILSRSIPESEEVTNE